MVSVSLLKNGHSRSAYTAQREKVSKYVGVLRPVNRYGYIRARERERVWCGSVLNVCVCVCVCVCVLCVCVCVLKCLR